ncbi:hypothetical protein HRG84_17415 [Flavisolibacter sp. BT320]|nr:hypothetical protein [Flavisolibacter longurius]
MPIYYFIYAAIAISGVLFLLRYFIGKKASLSTQLFLQGLHAENNGDYEAAAVTYESALVEIKKGRFNSSLQKKILEKLKVLQLVIDYQNDQNFIRTNKAR